MVLLDLRYVPECDTRGPELLKNDHLTVVVVVVAVVEVKVVLLYVFDAFAFEVHDMMCRKYPALCKVKTKG